MSVLNFKPKHKSENWGNKTEGTKSSFEVKLVILFWSKIEFVIVWVQSKLTYTALVSRKDLEFFISALKQSIQDIIGHLAELQKVIKVPVFTNQLELLSSASGKKW